MKTNFIKKEPIPLLWYCKGNPSNVNFSPLPPKSVFDKIEYLGGDNYRCTIYYDATEWERAMFYNVEYQSKLVRGDDYLIDFSRIKYK